MQELEDLNRLHGKPYGILGKTNIFKHFLDTGHKVLRSQFEIISSANKNNIFWLESIFINQLKPYLHGTLYSTPLGIIKLK